MSGVAVGRTVVGKQYVPVLRYAQQKEKLQECRVELNAARKEVRKLKDRKVKLLLEGAELKMSVECAERDARAAEGAARAAETREKIVRRERDVLRKMVRRCNRLSVRGTAEDQEVLRDLARYQQELEDLRMGKLGKGAGA